MLFFLHFSKTEFYKKFKNAWHLVSLNWSSVGQWQKQHHHMIAISLLNVAMSPITYLCKLYTQNLDGKINTFLLIMLLGWCFYVIFLLGKELLVKVLHKQHLVLTKRRNLYLSTTKGFCQYDTKFKSSLLFLYLFF